MKETLSGFGKIMDPSKWDSTVWYRVIRYPQVFRALMDDQRTPQILGRHIVHFSKNFKHFYPTLQYFYCLFFHIFL